MRCELARVRRHHRLFLVSLPRLFVGTSLSLHRHHSIGWTIVSRNHPPSSSTSFDSLTSHRFIAFQIALDTTRELVFLFLNFATCRFPSLPLPPPWSRSALPSLPPSLSLYLPRVQRSSWTDNIHIQVHKTSQNTSINPTLFSRFEVIIHQSAIPSHPIIHIHIHMFIPLHRHRAYTSLI